MAIRRTSPLILLALLILAAVAIEGLTPDSALANPHQKHGFATGEYADGGLCLKCHDIKAATDDYSLMWKNTMTQTCATCHGVYQAAPPTGIDGRGERVEVGTAATKSAYEMPLSEKLTHPGHRLQLNLGGVDELALFALNSDLVPGSSYPGRAGFSYLRQGRRWMNFIAGQDVSGFLGSGRSGYAGLYCGSCHSPHAGLKKITIPSRLTKAKMLTVRPNDQGRPISIASWKDWGVGGYQFCVACHDKRLGRNPHSDVASDRNHPAGFCLQCHGNNKSPVIGKADALKSQSNLFAEVGPTGPDASDFPHTGVENLVNDIPDQVCVATCHAFNLP